MRIVTPQHGFTLPEMVITVAVLAILAAIAVPSFQSTIDKRRLIGAAEQLYGDLQYARSEAINGDQRVGVYFSFGTTSWCYGIDDDTTSACNCTATVTNCTVNTVEKAFKSDGFRGVSLASPLGFGGTGPANETGFEPRRGLPMRAIGSTLAGGTVSFSSTSGGIDVKLSPQGRIILCSPSSPPLSGYPACPP